MCEYRRVTANINLDAILHNFQAVKNSLPPGTKVLSVLKSDAYGHGAVQTAALLADHTDYFGVSIIEEAMELRRAGIEKPILIFGYTSPDQFDTLLKNNIEQTVFQFDVAEELSRRAVSLGVKAKIHIEVDTGMRRTGFSADEKSAATVEKIAALPGIELRGVFTHFANADSADKTSLNKQHNLYVNFLELLDKRGVAVPIKHSCNSAGAISESECFDMVRVGLLLYGLFPSEDVVDESLGLIPAMELKTHVIFLKTVEAGEGVSYGHTYLTNKTTRIATLPIGYADGYPRALSSKARVLINGKFAPVIGRVCMDLMMVDVTDIDDVEIEDEVTLVGEDGGQMITADELGMLSDSINYEIICGISKRVPKVFFKNGREFLFFSSFDNH
jgi:alanine racemase